MTDQETLLQLSGILDTLISQESPGKDRDSNSINALLGSVLASYENRQLQTNSTNLTDGLSEAQIVSKIFTALKTMFSRNPSLLIEDNRHLSVLKSVFPFFNCLNCPNQLMDDVLFALIQITIDCFKKGFLVYNRLIFQQRDYILNHMEDLLSDVIKSFTNTTNMDTLMIMENIEDNLISFERFHSIYWEKISKISIAVRIIQYLVHPAIDQLYFSHRNAAFSLDSFISKCWFCLENTIINIKFVSENNVIIDKLDNIYSSLLQSTFNYYYNNPTSQFSRLQMVIQYCHFLLNWSLLCNFKILQVVLSQTLLKLAITLKSVNYEEYLWLNIGLSESSVRYFEKLIGCVSNPDLKRCLQLLMAAKFHDTDDPSQLVYVKKISQFKDTELQSLHERMKLSFGFGNLKFSLQTHVLTTDIIEDIQSGKVEKSIKGLSEIQLINTINALGDYACYHSGNYDIKTHSCRICDSSISISSDIMQSVYIHKANMTKDLHEVYTIIDVLLKEHQIQVSPNILISLLHALTKILRSYRPPRLGADSTLLKFIEFGFTHQLRIIRLLTVKLFPLILHAPEDEQYEQDFDTILSFLLSLEPESGNYYLFEGTIQGLGELLLVKSIDNKYYIVLSRLIRFMSDVDEFRSNLAIHQLRIVARTKNITPWQLVEPFIPLISRDVLKNRIVRPGLLTNFCIAIELSIPLFLERTLKYTIPYLIDSYKEDHISFISQTLKVPKSELIDTHLDGILAYLYATYDHISKTKLMKILSIYDSKYKGMAFEEMLNCCKGPYLIIHLLAYYSSNPETFNRIKNAVEIISVSLGYGQDGLVASQRLLNRWLLILVQVISTTLNDKKGSNPFYMKIRAIKSIGCLLNLCEKFDACLGQIIMALQLAIQVPDLRFESLLHIKLIAEKVDRKSMRFVFDSLISQFVLEFDGFSKKCQSLTTEIIVNLLKISPEKDVSYKFALRRIPSMKSINFQHVSDRRLLGEFRNRLKSDNLWVFEQVLNDLIQYLENGYINYQKLIREDELVYQVFLSITELLVTNSFKKYDQLDSDSGYKTKIALKSARVISLLGNLDLMKTSSHNTIKTFSGNYYDNISNFLLVTNLQKQKGADYDHSTMEFLIYFIKNILVRNFVSSVDPEEQKFLAYTIQEFLAICEIPPLIWHKFDDLTKSILEPLKSSRYKQGMKPRVMDLPIYKYNKEYNAWVKDFSANVLHNCAILADQVLNAPEQISSICTVIPLLDVSISKFVLPYAILFLVIMCPESNIAKKNIQQEFMSILSNDLSLVQNQVIREGLKKYFVTIIEIFQFLKAWSSKVKDEEDASKASNKNNSKIKRTGVQRIGKFLKYFPHDIMAKRCADCDIYEGSILFLENGYKDGIIPKDVFFSTLKDMYVKLEDYDQLHGALKLFSTNSLSDKLLQFKFNEDIQISNESLRAIAQYNFDDDPNQKGTTQNASVTELFEVLNKNCEYEQLLLNLKNYEAKVDDGPNQYLINTDWILHGIQASIYTGDMDNLERWSYSSQNSNAIAISGSDMSILYEIAQGLIALHKQAIPSCCRHIENAIEYIGLAISNSQNFIQKKISDYMILLHSLYDFQILAKMNSRDDKVIQILKNRLDFSKQDYKSVWKIHSLKSSIYKLHPGKDFQTLYKDSLVEGCRILRENGKLPQATRLITKALVLNENDDNVEMTQASTMLMNVEFSKLFWAQNDYETALKTLKLVVDNLHTKNPYYLDFSLTYLNWMDVSAEGSSDEIKERYNALIRERVYDNSGDVNYQYAVYLNKLLEAQILEESDGSLDYAVIKQYLLAVSASKKYVHEILPKAVTLWLDYYHKYIDIEPTCNITKKLSDSRHNSYQLINKTVEKSVSNLGKKWYIVLSQIISRITHDDKNITELISKVIVELTVKYPWLILYSVFSQARSVDEKRKAIGTMILTKLQDSRNHTDSKTLQLPKLIASGLILLESIMSVCNTTNKFKHPKSGTLYKDLYKDLGFDYPRDSECLALALPIKENVDLLYNLKNDVDKHVIFYSKFHEKVKILFSLQQPKRVRVTGTNGETYFLLFKPRDDLRKDNKVMEFSTVMNDLLSKNYETQTRNMQIKSFAATPLNETTGIIEWVQNVVTLRHIIDGQFKRQNIIINMRNMKNEFGDAKPSEKRAIFESYLDKFPPILGKWMIENFPNIYKWYRARETYTRSLAVMSIVGYLIGVGDRHLDNIMINRKTGIIMHIDFDCMFEKGKKLSVPEIVPFRLTPHLIEAMGVLGYEGAFRKSCELTMSIIRENENILMNFLESFIHDPLMDWRSGSSDGRASDDKALTRIKKQQEKVYKILRRKIKGILSKEDDNTGYRDSGGLSVSVSLQVDLLIQTAVSHENLSKMFFGWMPYL